MSIDIKFYQEAYFTFDKPVPYNLKCGEILNISPIKLSDSLIFMTSYGILDIDKNSTNDVEISFFIEINVNRHNLYLSLNPPY